MYPRIFVVEEGSGRGEAVAPRLRAKTTFCLPSEMLPVTAVYLCG